MIDTSCFGSRGFIYSIDYVDEKTNKQCQIIESKWIKARELFADLKSKTTATLSVHYRNGYVKVIA